MTARLFAIALAAILGSGSSNAVELRQIEARVGTEGLEPLRLVVRNASSGDLACEAQIAHWYSIGIGRIAPGDLMTRRLWRDPASGTVSVLNAKRENLPIESLWCGFAGRAWQTRAPIVLDHAREGRPVELTCRPARDALVCK